MLLIIADCARATIMALEGQQLFLSKRIVAENKILDGGILVNEAGVIEKLVTRSEADKIIADNDGKIKVNW